jgi:transcriptional regulator with XRE-family HTH domain
MEAEMVRQRKKRTVKRQRLARLGKFLRENELVPNEVADVTGISRQHLLRLRYGRCEPTRPLMIWLTIACRRLVGGRRRVRITELFDLGDGER